jgi:hypothetical protein
MRHLQPRANPATRELSLVTSRSAVRVRSSALSNQLRKRNTQNRSDTWEQMSADCGSEGRRFESRRSPSGLQNRTPEAVDPYIGAFRMISEGKVFDLPRIALILTRM